jgi:hypothetical protein
MFFRGLQAFVVTGLQSVAGRGALTVPLASGGFPCLSLKCFAVCQVLTGTRHAAEPLLQGLGPLLARRQGKHFEPIETEPECGSASYGYRSLCPG